MNNPGIVSLHDQALAELADRFDKASVEIEELPSDWIEHNFWIPTPRDPITGEDRPSGNIILAPHQKRIMNEALGKKSNGNFKYATVIYSAPKKSGKSALASSAALYMAAQISYAQVYCVANDGRSSQDRLFIPIWRCLNHHAQTGGPIKTPRLLLTEAFLSNYSHIRPIPVDASGEAGAEPTMVLYSELWGFIEEQKKRLFCYDDKTEILTQRGWLTYDQLEMTDRLATLNQTTKELEWQAPISINIFDYEGEMYSIDSRDLSACVTEGHRFYGKVTSGVPDDTIRLVEEIHSLSQFGFRVAPDSAQMGTSSSNKTVRIDGTSQLEDLELPLIPYLRFMGWYISEGWVDRKPSGYPMRVNIAQAKKSPYYTSIREVLECLGLSYTLSKDGFRINDVRLANHVSGFGRASEKYVPIWIKELSPEYLWHFLCAYHDGDGGKTETTWTYYTTSSKLKDDLAEIGVRLGARVRVGVIPPRKKEHNTKYRVVFSYFGKHRYVKRGSFKRTFYKGKVWCPSVPNGLVYVRRNETYYFAGNSEMTIPPTLWGKAMRWIESYAGFMGVSNLLWDMYQLAVRDGIPHPDFTDLRGRDGEPVVWINESAHLFAYWDTVARMPWQSQEYYEQEAKLLSNDEFKRIHQNQWVSPVGSFVDSSHIDACDDPTVLPLPIGSNVPVVLGVDAALTGDTAAIVAVTRHPVSPDIAVAVRYVKIFKAEPGKPIQIERDLGREIRKLSGWWNIVCVAYDKYQMEGMAQNYRRGEVALTAEELDGMSPEEQIEYRKQESKRASLWYYNFSQMSLRNVSDKQLYDSILSLQLRWNLQDRDSQIADLGAGESLVKHLKQAGKTETGGKMRIEKLSDDTKVDAAVALSMANYQCRLLNIDNTEIHPDDLIRRLTKGELTLDQFTSQVEAMRTARRLLNG